MVVKLVVEKIIFTLSVVKKIKISVFIRKMTFLSTEDHSSFQQQQQSCKHI